MFFVLNLKTFLWKQRVFVKQRFFTKEMLAITKCLFFSNAHLRTLDAFLVWVFDLFGVPGLLFGLRFATSFCSCVC